MDPAFLLDTLPRLGIKSTSYMVRNAKDNVFYFVRSTDSSHYVLKLAKDPKTNPLIEAEHDNLRTLHRTIAGHPSLQHTAPVPLLLGSFQGRAFLVTNWLLGRKRPPQHFGPSECNQAISWITALNTRTREDLPGDEAILVHFLSQYSNSPTSDPSLPDHLQAAFLRLAAAFRTQNLNMIPLAFSHNDLSPANILFAPARIYVVDWVSATPKGFLFLDLFNLLLYLINKPRNNYLSSLMHLYNGTDNEMLTYRRYISSYATRFQLSSPLLRWLIDLHLISKAYRLHHARRYHIVEQLMGCLNFTENADLHHAIFAVTNES